MRVDEFLQDFTLAQLLPGPTFANLSITLGHRLAGIGGAFGGLLAVIVPGGVILIVLAAIYLARGLTPEVTTLMRGMSAAVVGLVAVTTLRMARPALISVRAVSIAAVTFVAVGPLRLNTPLVIVVMTAIGLWLHRPAVAMRLRETVRERTARDDVDGPVAEPDLGRRRTRRDSRNAAPGRDNARVGDGARVRGRLHARAADAGPDDARGRVRRISRPWLARRRARHRRDVPADLDHRRRCRLPVAAAAHAPLGSFRRARTAADRDRALDGRRVHARALGVARRHDGGAGARGRPVALPRPDLGDPRRR